ncbi:MAG: response regulator [Bacteroidota bacterium]|jgi:DNA-binding NarL/FixJ family response regulator
MKAIVSVDDEMLITQVLKFQLSKHFDQNELIVETLNEPNLTGSLIEEIIAMGIEVPLVIVDYQMPKINGAQLIMELRKNYPKIRYVMLSGQANEVVVEELIEAGVIDAFISKPWEENELLRKLEALLHE